MKNKIYIAVALAKSVLFLNACDGFLDREPESALTPEQYMTTEANVASYATDLYVLFSVHGKYGYGTFGNDANTDNMAYYQPSNMYAPGYWKVGQTGGDYSFTNIYRCNWFFDNVLKPFEAGKISGNESSIKHYIGEVYFFRALCYFSKLQSLGDFPIVTKCIDNDLDALVAQSKRQPRNEVARFILSDLDKAIELMGAVAPVGGKNRLNKDCAYLLKSRVALYEGTWLKYFKGTAFIPNGPDWPGKVMDYNANYQYPTGSIDSELDWFLGVAMESAKIVADKYALVENTGSYQEKATDPVNPYYDMFSAVDMSVYSEVMLFKSYDWDLGVVNSVSAYASRANNGTGTTKSMVDAFIMQNGLPIYAEGSGYPGDTDLHQIDKGRDTRLQIFLKKEGERNFFDEAGEEGTTIEPWPNITCGTYNNRYVTGYCLRKGMSHDGAQATFHGFQGCLVYRATEAYLNYIEACYVKTGSIDATADSYWKAIRARAGVETDYTKTINATKMAIESQTDWGAYSGGKLIDATLFNIRRERRCELMAEGLRNMDLHRWRALDQMIEKPYHVLGINLWANANLKDIEKASDSKFVEDKNVSSKSFSIYLAPYHISQNNNCYDGYKFRMAHYLSPIAVQHFLITGNSDVAASTLYQNPFWPTKAGEGAQL